MKNAFFGIFTIRSERPSPFGSIISGNYLTTVLLFWKNIYPKSIFII